MKEKTLKALKVVSKKVPVDVKETAYPYADKEELLAQLNQHYQWWTDDNEHRATRPGGWNDITDAYYGKLPDDWPFISKTVDPRIRTSLLEKNARLTKNNLKGKVLPREGGDVLKARINNSIIDYQWQAANDGGSMQQKISICDMDSRLYQSKFAYVYWREAKDGDGKTVFRGNELKPLDIRDCGMDPTCDHIRNAKWFQHRMWMPWKTLEENKDLYPGFDELEMRFKDSKSQMPQKRRDSAYKKRLKELKGLEDRMGTDRAFPILPVVVEYRMGEWIYFSPDYNVILSITKNVFDHAKIPVSQLRYYPTDGDNLGESEVESVLPLWKAIQAIMCSFLDEVLLKMRPPLKIQEGAARIETLVYQPEAQWLMDNVNAVMEMETHADAIRYFQNTYPALVSAFNTAMGDMSQGTSNIDPLSADKTATEIRQVAKQQNTRDQKNQQELAEFIKDVVSMWIVNNKQFLFKKSNKEYVLRILGGDAQSYFERAGLGAMEPVEGAEQAVGQLVQEMTQAGSPPSDMDIANMVDAAKVPKYPVITGEDGEETMKPKLRTSEMGDNAELSVVPEDLDGLYDYVPDMKSMESSANEQMVMARMQAVNLMTNPNILTILAQQGVKPLIKELLVSNFEDTGLTDAQKYFETSDGSANPAAPGADPAAGGVPANGANIGMANPPKAPTQPSVDQQMAGSNQLPL